MQTRVPPFPAYRFTGESLSGHPEVEIRIEDGYFSRTDAAVVFQRIDRRNGDVRYLYHGNDGTNMPWNDTAQLDMLKSEVREAVIKTILGVARRFSIIRFDAAMTLAKKHFARLWYPQPGTGGDIPSRADYSLTQKEFDSLFPVEFWREVVDRINTELPNTLLLAEAFWLMEGYFVRTLGMHRVYNSAFMHMLKNEENEKYRDLITNTLEFEPEILKRYVNFMSNPDEETAVKQFGSGDKYFGVCVLMCTLPGLPMFAHGQIEAFTEKYGMEYQRAYYNEQQQQWHIERHEREIFPLLRKRYLFSEVEHFNFFDTMDVSGMVQESVLAFSNRYGQERVLVVYNNRYEMAAGYLNKSCPKLYPDGNIRSLHLAELLGLSADQKQFYLVTEHISGLEYLISGWKTGNHGFYLNLRGFEYRVFWNFREVYDNSGFYALLYQNLEGCGVTSIDKAINELEFTEIYTPFKQLFDPAITDQVNQGTNQQALAQLSQPELFERYRVFVESIIFRFSLPVTSDAGTELFSRYMKAVHDSCLFASQLDDKKPGAPKSKGTSPLWVFPDSVARGSNRRKIVLTLALYAQKALAELVNEPPPGLINYLKTMQLVYPLQEVLQNIGLSNSEIETDLLLLEILVSQRSHAFVIDCMSSVAGETSPNISGGGECIVRNLRAMGALLNEHQIQKFIKVHYYNDTRYYSKEQFEELAGWVFEMAIFDFFYSGRHHACPIGSPQSVEVLNTGTRLLALLKQYSRECGYQFDDLILRLNHPNTA